MSISDYFLSLMALVPLVVLITDIFIRVFQLEKKLAKQITATLVSLALCAIGGILKLGMFADFSIWETIAYTIGTALGAMGFYTIEKIQQVLDFLLQWLPKKK